MKINIGDGWVDAIKSSHIDRELNRVYKSGLPTIVKLFDSYVKSTHKEKIALADFGGAVGDVTEFLTARTRSSIPIKITCFDAIKSLLDQNHSTDTKVVKDLRKLNVKDKFDVGIMRYVLNYNEKEDQLRILENIHQALKNDGIFINYWCGVSNQKHQSTFQELFRTKNINAKFFRKHAYWSTLKETKTLFKQAGFKVELIKEFKIPIQHLYQVRYHLTNEENINVLNFLGKYKFISYAIFIAKKV